MEAGDLTPAVSEAGVLDAFSLSLSNKSNIPAKMKACKDK
jgi:hypothetical protein